MRDSKNIWEEKFNDASLDDQAWLEPAIDVFDNISDEIYGSSKKRYSLLILFFLFAALIVSVALLIMPSTDNDSNDSGENTSEVKTSQLSMLPSFSYKDVETKNNDGSDLNVDTRVIQEIITNENIESTSNNFRVGKNKIQSLKSKSNKSRIARSTKSSLKESQGVESSNSNMRLPVSKIQSDINRKFYDSAVEVIDVDLVKNKIPFVVDEEKTTKPIAGLQSIKTVDATQLKSINVVPPLLFEDNSFINPQVEYNNTSYIAVGSNFEFWNFSLNNNYATALNPADFSHTSGKAASLNVNLGTQLYKKLNLVGGVSVQKIQFTSGHNSALSYQLNQEQDGDASNMFNLTMASPIGFLESDLIVQRNSAASSIATDLIVDLHNEHNITNLDVNIGLDYTLVESNKLSFILGFRTGINKFLNINNALTSFDLDNNNFSSGATDIVKDQSNVNTLTTYIGSSLKVEYNVANNLSIGTNIGLTTNLAPIYQENDFSTQLSRIQSGVYVQFGF